MMDAYQKIAAKTQACAWLPLGAVKPTGWMRAQMQRDLEDGFLGHLDELVPDLIVRDDIYGADRLTAAARTKDLGVVSKETDWQVQFLWWNSETQSNWRDGLLRTALLLDHPAGLERARAVVEHILATQDADGYLGIYAPDLRYSFSGENGELWAQASLFRVLLGYYEAAGDARALEAVIRAVEVTMRAYPIHASHPFTVKDDYAGVCHGLMFTDALDRLHQLTGDPRYLDYALWLYREYSENDLSAGDIRLANLSNPDYRFHAHGAHTYEHLRALLTAVYASGSPALEEALAAYLQKLERYLTPSGAPIGDEFIGGRQADASETGYEYCSIHELLDSYTHLLQKTGDPRWGDRIEWLLFNAGQGARHPITRAGGSVHRAGIAYLKTDNSTSMTGKLHPADPLDALNPQTRYKYSPAHQDVAVCCVPNAGRIYPYYVRSMWLRTPEGLMAALYGPCELKTQVNGAEVRILEETNYPFRQAVTFSIETSAPVEFELTFRIPPGLMGFTTQTTGETRQEGRLIKVRKTWQSGDKIVLEFAALVEKHAFGQDEFFFSFGTLVMALPLEAHAAPGRQYPGKGFGDLTYTSADPSSGGMRLLEGELFEQEDQRLAPKTIWDEPFCLTGRMYNPAANRVEQVRLVPMGGTLLRQVTFRKNK